MRRAAPLARPGLARLLAVAALQAGWLAAAPAFGQASDVPYVPTPTQVIDAMLDIAKVGPRDFVIDLGSGDGRIVITAARKHGARGFGVDLDGSLVAEARREAARQGVADRAEFHARNLFITDIAQATVLTSYLSTRVNLQLRPRIFSELRPGTRVVSHEFDFGNWKPDAQVRVSVPGKPYGPPSSEVFLWIVPANAAGRWQWRAMADGAAIEWDVALEQTFQMLAGSARAMGRPARLEQASLRGDEISLRLAAHIDGREIVQELTGRISGESIRGTARGAGAPTALEWHAKRVSGGKMNIDGAAESAAVALYPQGRSDAR